MINASEIIGLDYTIIHGENIYGSKDIDKAAAYYKQSLYETFQGKTVGKVIHLWTNEFFHIVAALKASWELGCTIFAADYNPGYFQIPEFKNFHDFIDVVIGHKDTHVNPSKDVCPNKPHIYIEHWDRELSSKTDYVLDQALDHNTPAVITHTSGTTGFPKLRYFSHQQVINIAQFEREMNQIDSSDVGMHIKTLHHGSLFLNFALPLLTVCKTHHCIHNYHVRDNITSTDPRLFLQYQLEYAVKNNITKFMIPYNWIRFLPEVEPIDLEQKVSIHTIVGPPNDEMRIILEKFNPKNVTNMWGCTEVGSVFHSVTDKQNVESYNPNHFEIVNPYIDYTINPDHLLLKWKTDSEWNKIADKFVQHDQYLQWLGRTSTININDHAVSISRLKDFIEQKFDTVHFAIVPDYELNLLYLAVFDQRLEDLDQINHQVVTELGHDYKLSQIVKCDYGKHLHGMKPSQPLLLYMFRNRQSQHA